MKKLISVILVILFVLPLSVLPTGVAADDPEPGAAAFTDVKAGSWYEKAVNYVYGYGLMTGTAADKFEPKTVLSRAMAVLVLAKAADADLSAYSGAAPEFSDVEPGRWYTAAVAWANDNQIAVGTGVLFGTTDPVTREQLALMMKKLASLQNIVNKYENTELSLDRFTDADQISGWALYAVEWAVHNGLIAGNDKSQLNPKGKATRAEAAQIFFNFHTIKRTKMLPFDTSYVEKLEITESDTPRIICWGDSLTEGYGVDKGLSYPDYLRQLTGLEVLNYGVSAEWAFQISMREGGTPIYVEPCTIPATTEKIVVGIIDDRGYDNTEFIYFPRNGKQEWSSQDSINPFYIAGVEGTLIYEREGEYSGLYTFTRSEEGEEVTLMRPTQGVTHAMADRRSNDILVIWSGSNDFATPEKLPGIIAYQRNMLSFAGAEKFVILDFTAESMIKPVEQVNALMAQEYGANCIGIRNHLMTRGLDDAGISPTPSDLQDLGQNKIPGSLLVDGLHGTPAMNEIVAKQIYAKFVALGYIAA